MKINLKEITRKQDLEKFDTNVLLSNYNELTGKNTSKFASRAKGIDQFWKVVAETRTPAKAEPKSTPKLVEKKEAAEIVNAKRTGKKAFRYNFVFPAKDEIKPAKPGTGRHQIISLLKSDGGLTFDEIMKETGWAENKVYEAIRLAHWVNGHQIKQNAETGKISIVK